MCDEKMNEIDEFMFDGDSILMCCSVYFFVLFAVGACGAPFNALGGLQGSGLESRDQQSREVTGTHGLNASLAAAGWGQSATSTPVTSSLMAGSYS